MAALSDDKVYCRSNRWPKRPPATDDREVKVKISFDFGVRAIITLAMVSLLTGCSRTTYKPGTQGAPALMVSEARRSLAETLRTAKIHGGRPYKETLVLDDGFSLTWLANGEARTRQYRFRALNDLSVKESGRESFVELGPETEEQAAWDSPGEARRFVDAVHALGYLTSAQPLAGDNAAFAEFSEKAAAWREMRPRPELPEGARRYKTLAEEASANKDFEGAASFYEQGLAIHPFWAEGQYNAALLYAETGMYAKAIGHMKRYLELVPNAPDARAARDKMQAWETKIAPGAR
jgi:tetratricopeptide (TPR) repeat protein